MKQFKTDLYCDKIEVHKSKEKPKLELKLNPDFKKYRPTEEDREEEINEMKDSITGSEGDR